MNRTAWIVLAIWLSPGVIMYTLAVLDLTAEWIGDQKRRRHDSDSVSHETK